MNVDLLQRKLVAAARAHPPEDRVPYAFEQRIMTRLSSPSPMDPWALWSRALWRAAAPCVAAMVLLTVWTAFAPPPAQDQSANLTDDFERTVLVGLDHPEETW